MKPLPRYTIGHGDRFSRQGAALVQAVLDARVGGINIAPVWNKSMREHTLIGSQPQSLRDEVERPEVCALLKQIAEIK